MLLLLHGAHRLARRREHGALAADTGQCQDPRDSAAGGGERQAAPACGVMTGRRDEHVESCAVDEAGVAEVDDCERSGVTLGGLERGGQSRRRTDVELAVKTDHLDAARRHAGDA